MNSSFWKTALWVLITAAIFTLFRWLFGIGVPGLAWQFASGITVILVGGLLFGRYVSRLWVKANKQTYNNALLVLVLLILLSFIGIAWLVNRMIHGTQFFHFFLTCVLLFLVSTFSAMLISL